VEGVRRSVAAREVGLATIAALMQTPDGTMVPVFNVQLDVLFSTKVSVSRLETNHRYLQKELAMANPVDRSNLPAIVIRAVSTRLARLLTPLKDVVLEI